MLLHKYESIVLNIIHMVPSFHFCSKTFSRRLCLFEYTMNWLSRYENAIELWTCNKHPPGRWILTSYDDESIIVYQTYHAKIIKFACENNRCTECPVYNENHMTWVETSLSLDDVSIEMDNTSKSKTYSRNISSTFSIRWLLSTSSVY